MDMIKNMHKQRLVILVLAAIGAISAFLPWATIEVSGWGVTIRDSVSGIQGDGLITLLAFIAAGVLAFLGEQKELVTTEDKFKWGVVGTGALAALVAIIAMINVSSVPLSSVGWGVFLSILAGGAIAAIPFLDPKTFDKFPIGVGTSADGDSIESNNNSVENHDNPIESHDNLTENTDNSTE